MTVLVTGGSGFVGHHLVAALVRRGHSVRVLCRSRCAVSEDREIQFLEGDINDRATLARSMTGVKTVYHVAGLVPGCGGNTQMWQTNVAGSSNVAQVCTLAGVNRLVLVSSVAAYRAPLPAVVCETSPIGGMDLYGRSKTAAELAARRTCCGQMELVLARPCQIYGPGDRSGYTQRLLGLLGSAMLPVAGWAGRSFSLIHVADAAEALCAAGERDGIDGAIFNIAPEARISLLELADIHASLRRRKRRGIRIPIPGPVVSAAMALRWTAMNWSPGHGRPHFRSYGSGQTHGSLMLGGPLYDSQAARTLLAFRPSRTFEQGLSEL